MAPIEKILVTGSAGFIGFHLSSKLTSLGYHVVGIDNLNDYYDVSLKESRLAMLKKIPNFRFEKVDLADGAALNRLFADESFSAVVNLAAQAGVRYSLINPHAYIESKLHCFLNILEACRHN